MIADAMTAARQAAAADRRLFVQLPAPLVALTATNHVLDANPALQRWLGHRADAWSGRTLASFVHPADQLRLGRALRDWRGGPAGGHLGVHRIRQADGAHVPATFDVCELPDLVAGRIVLLGDRSALQERERDLRRLRRRLEQFVLDAPVGMFEAAADGSLCFTNARWEQLHRRVAWCSTGPTPAMPPSSPGCGSCTPRSSVAAPTSRWACRTGWPTAAGCGPGCWLVPTTLSSGASSAWWRT
ncbi:MAG: PAS domain-containing protein [Acidimicrobiales bacterium]